MRAGMLPTFNQPRPATPSATSAAARSSRSTNLGQRGFRQGTIGLMAVWMLRGALALFLLASAFGFLRLHGPGGDLGVVAGVLALMAWAGLRWTQRPNA